jgi:phage-related protein
VKQIIWLGDSLARRRAFPAEARREAGYQLERVQAGKAPVGGKPMAAIGLGVSEIRVRVGGAFRVIYLAKYAEAIYVLHAFQKKSRGTSHLDIELARNRFRAFIRERTRQ